MLENKKKQWNVRVTIVIIMIGAFGTVIEGLLKDLEDLQVDKRVGTIQTTTLLKTARILRLEETCCHLNPSEKPSGNADAKNSKIIITIIIISNRIFLKTNSSIEKTYKK